jgi:precorrin-6B methylase 2
MDKKAEFGGLRSTTEGQMALEAFSERHGITAAPTLTVIDDEIASLIVERLEPRILGKTVVEIGGGIGLLSLHMATVAKKVYCIEANPMWVFAFAELLLKRKPKNLSYLFGAADEFVGDIKGDLAIVFSHSGLSSMMSTAKQFAPVAVDFYGELVEANPLAFDSFARQARLFT